MNQDYYYKKLILRKKLIKHFLFFKGKKYIYKINFFFLNARSRHGIFSDFGLMILSIKKMLPLLLRKMKVITEILFVSTQALFSKVLCVNDYKPFIKKITARKKGVLSNRFKLDHKDKKVGKWKPSVIVFVNFKEKEFLLYESKLIGIPTVALVSAKQNTCLVEYPVIVNRVFFFTEFFFLMLFVKIVVKHKK